MLKTDSNRSSGELWVTQIIEVTSYFLDDLEVQEGIDQNGFITVTHPVSVANVNAHFVRLPFGARDFWKRNVGSSEKAWDVIGLFLRESGRLAASCATTITAESMKMDVTFMAEVCSLWDVGSPR